jgi:hypothetical protein
MKHFFPICVIALSAAVQVFVNTAGAAEATPQGVCKTFTKNPAIITHNGQHPVRDFRNLVELNAEVADSSTLIVTGKGGNKFKVRFVGASAPAPQAKDFLQKQIAAAGGKVVMFHDGLQDNRDGNNRHARLVCVINRQGELVCLDELLIRNGLAKAAAGNYSSKPYFQQIKPKEKPDSPNFPTTGKEKAGTKQSETGSGLNTEKRPAPNSDAIIADLFAKQLSDVQVAGSGVVEKLLADDNEGDRHQRFILKLASGQTLLAAHNIDIAPRLAGLAAGDTVEFYGEYYYNAKGGGIHWTHRDPAGKHTDGWLKWKGKMYQ